MQNQPPKITYLKDYTPPDYLIEHVDLHFDLHEDTTEVNAKMQIRRNPQKPPNVHPSLVLNGQQLELVAIMLNDQPLQAQRYQLTDEYLTLFDPPEQFQLTLTTRIHPKANTALEGLYVSNGNFCTQCEAEGFRKITYFLDRPDVMATYTTTIVADGALPVLLSNGNLIDHGILEDNRHFAIWQDPFKKPCYLFALVAGQLERLEDEFITCSGRQVKLHVYVEPGHLDQADYAMISLKNAMAWDEQVYGREYDLNIYMIVAVSDFNMGAMENKGLNIFNTKYVLAKPETATDADYQGIEGVIAHEYFHNWTGNRITCRDWFQLSLKEGLTVFRDQEFSADRGSRPVKRIADVRLLRTTQFPQDAGPMAHPVRPESYIEINNFYTVTVYNKGAEVIRMMHTLLGPTGFRRGMDLYFERHDGEAVTTDDFVKAMEDANGVDFTQFRRWYDQAGTPQLHVTDEYDPHHQTYVLTIRQSCPPTPGQPYKAPFHIPLVMGLLDSQGHELPLQLANETHPVGHQRILELREAEHRFVFIHIPEKPLPSLLRDFSAPVQLYIDYQDEELIFLLTHDRNAFNRWDAGQQFFIRWVLRLVAQKQQPSSWTVPESLIMAFRSALTDQLQNNAIDGAFLDQLLTLPSENYLAEQMEVVDVEGIHEACRFIKRGLAAALQAEFIEVYLSYQKDEYRLDAEAMGRRSLKNRCLDYLMALETAEIRHYAVTQFERATQMTDSLAALTLLAHYECPEQADALTTFYHRWQHEPLVIDKWFTLQATSPLPDTLTRVQDLLKHPAFTLKNPNRVRSLISAFSQANPIRFHTDTGAGYQILTDQILAIDPLNPQIAARLLNAFTRWRKYDTHRQNLMRAQLERILKTPALSNDVYEIAVKSIQASTGSG